MIEGEFPRDEIIVHVSANSYYGARHGLETLSQLITFDALGKFKAIFNFVLLGQFFYIYVTILVPNKRTGRLSDNEKRPTYIFF